MRTVGVDFAARPAKTALCAIRWVDGRAKVEELRLGVTDDDIVGLGGTGDEKIGVDCPFGWPKGFVEAVNAHHARHKWPGGAVDPETFRRELRFRETDRYTAQQVRPNPLSVSTDRIGVTAMRLAGIFDTLAGKDLAVDRAGGGQFVEVYPAAALDRWGLPSSGYKRRPQVLAPLVGELLDQTPWLNLSDEQSAGCRTSDDLFDALVSALVARAAALGQTDEPATQQQKDRAVSEGWIHLPASTSLSNLVD